MATNIFPGVYTTIRDESFTMQPLPGAIGFICILSEKGPDNVPRMTTSVQDLIKTYGKGNPAKYGQGWYIAKQYLGILGNLYVMRVMPDDSAYANLGLQVTEGTVTGEELGVGNGTISIFSLAHNNIVPSSYTVYVDGVPQEEGNNLVTVVGENVGVGDGNTLQFTLDFAPIAASAGYAVYVDGIEVDSSDYTLDPKTGVITFAAGKQPFDGAVVTADYKYYDSDYTLDLETGTVSFNEGREPASGAVVTADYSYNNNIQTVSFVNLASVNTINTKIVDDEAKVIFYTTGRGTWYNNLAIKLTKSSEYADQFKCYNLDVYQKTEEGEYVIVETFLVSLDPSAVDFSNESLFIEDVLERYSELLRAKVAEDIDPTLEWSTPFTTYINLANGDNGNLFNPKTGYLNWQEATPLLIQGYSGTNVNPETGEMNSEITDPDCLLFSVVFDAGYPTEVKDSIVDLCNARTDCFAFLDNGDNPSPSAALKARQTVNTYNDFRVALFEMYTKVYDPYTGKYHWMSPIYHFAQAFAKTERDYDLWWPAAGLTRGVVTGIKDVRYKLVGGYKDQFKLNQLNPIMRWSHGGDCIWGNWTTQRRPSALQNIHVVLTLLYIKRTLEWNLKYYIYDLNDKYTWELIKGNVNSFLGELKSRRALEWFKVDVFATEYDKKINRCQVKVDLKITGAIEIISVTLAVH